MPHSPIGNPKPTPSPGHLSLSNITKRFSPSSPPILHNLSLSCLPGQFVVLVGPSGCGKSTLLNIAAGMTPPDSGAVTLDNRPVTSPSPSRSMVFQEHTLFPWLTASQNIAFGLKMANIPKSERDDRVHAALSSVHLTHSSHKLIHQLSGGMKQRVAIARALVLDPAVLLMDEPFAALDAQTRTLLHLQLQELWGNTHKTILFVTHSVGEAVRLADRIIVLHAHPGRIRREIAVPLPHPRRLDSPDLNELARIVRKEIEEEVTHVNAAQGLPPEDLWTPHPPDLDPPPLDDLGHGI